MAYAPSHFLNPPSLRILLVEALILPTSKRMVFEANKGPKASLELQASGCFDMGNEMGNGNVSRLGAPAVDVSDGALEPSPSSSHETGLRSSEAAPAELENRHERKAAVTDSHTSGADHNLVQMMGLNTREDEERKHSCASVTLDDAGETSPNPSVVVTSDINGNTNKQLSCTEEVTAVGIDIMTEKSGESSREHDPCNSDMDGGENAEVVVTEEDDALGLGTDEWVSISEEAKSHELIVLAEHNVADENSGGFDKRADIMGEYSIDSISHVSQEEIDYDEEEILLKVFNGNGMETSERDSTLQEPESHVVINVVGEGNLADQSSTEDGEYDRNEPITQDIIRDLQLDSSPIGHESFVYLEAIDAQIKDMIVREKEEAEGVSQLEQYESMAVLTTIFAKNEGCSLRKEEIIVNMCRSTTEYVVDGLVEHEHLGEDENETKKALSSEGYEFDTNHPAAPTNHEEYLSAKQVQYDITTTSTIELEGTSPITDLEEEKNGQFRSEVAMVQVALKEDIVCETKCMHQNVHFGSDKNNESCHEENNVNTDVHCEANNKFMLTENEAKGASVILDKSNSIEDGATEFSFCSIVTVERVGVVEKDEVLIVKEDNVIEEIGLTGGNVDQPLKEQPYATNSVQVENLVNSALSTSENIENNERQFPLSSIVNVEKAIKDRFERVELLIEKRGNVAEKASVDDLLKGEPSLTNLVQEQQSVNVSLVMEAAISPQSCLSVQDIDLDQPCNISSEYVTESNQSCSLMQSEVEEYKEMALTLSYQVICGGKAENSGQQSDFSFQYFTELGEIDTKEQSKVTEKEEETSTKLEPENCIVFDFDVRECSDINFECLEPNVLSMNSPIEEGDVAHLQEVKDQFVNQIVTNDTKEMTCMTESCLDRYGVINFGECTEFSSADLTNDPLTVETVSEVENKESNDEDEETHQLDESVGQPREDFGVAPLDHDGLESSNNHHKISNYDYIQSMTDLNHNVFIVDFSDCSDTSGDFEISVKKSENSTLEQFEDESDGKPEDEMQADNEPQEEVKSIIVEHQSVQDSIFSNNKSEGDECQEPLQELPTVELNEETPSMEIYESGNVSKFAMKNTMETEASTATTDRRILHSSPSQHIMGVEGLISVFVSSSTDAELNSKNAISDLQDLQVKNSTAADSISFGQCGSYSTQIRTLPEGDTWTQIEMQNAEANLPAIEVRNEEPDQNQMSLQEKSSEEVPSTLARTSSERLKAPLLSFIKNEINIVQSQEKGDGVTKNASDKAGRSPSRKPMATPSRRHEKHKSKSSFFSTCMCCTTDL